MKHSDKINIAGYDPELDYGGDFGEDCIIQMTYHFSQGSKISFYNRHRDEIETFIFPVAVWHIKQRH